MIFYFPVSKSTFSDRRLCNSACYTLLRSYCLKNKQRQTTGVKSVSIKEEKKDTFIHLNFENEFERKYRSLDRRIQNQNWSNRRICTRSTPLVKPIECSEYFFAENVFQPRHTPKTKNCKTEVRSFWIKSLKIFFSLSATCTNYKRNRISRLGCRS